MEETKGNLLVLLTGATGYIGGRLAPRLLQAGYRVRCIVRDPERLKGRPWLEQVEVVAGDVLQSETLARAMAGVNAAYYLVHSMAGGQGFHERDLVAARNFGTAAAAAGVGRIIYLGGLGDPESELSQHLRSRQQTGAALCECGVPVTEFRAGVIVGSGSLSFELIRYLIERLPVMLCPRWLYTCIQPIGVRNVLEYLIAALETPASVGEIIEIGGADVLTYGDMMLGYARARGLKRRLIPVPVLTPRLSAYWVHLATSIPAAIAEPLIEGLRNEVVVRDDKAARLFPEIKPFDYQTAVELALVKLDSGEVETMWSDALMTTQGDVPPVVLGTVEGMDLEHRQLSVQASVATVFEAFAGLGGGRGWLYLNWVWHLRGLLDRLVGGVGMRRGRRDADCLRVGEALDFWRVEAVEPDHLIRLRAEMKMPGRGWLQFHVHPQGPGKALLSQTAYFAPKGVWGFIYWYGLYPIHKVVFAGMIRKIAERAVALEPAAQNRMPAADAPEVQAQATARR
jgi:uncharacterized protein YbjT (DUF2867 family)